MRSAACGSAIQLLLQPSSSIGAGSRVEVVDFGEYNTNRLTALAAWNFFHFQIETGPRRAEPSLSYFVDRQSRYLQEIMSFSIFDFLDRFRTLKARKDKKTQPRQKSKKAADHSCSWSKKTTRPCCTPSESSWPPLFDKQQGAPMPLWRTSQSLLKVARIRANFPDTLPYKKSRHFGPRWPGRGCRATQLSTWSLSSVRAPGVACTWKNGDTAVTITTKNKVGEHPGRNRSKLINRWPHKGLIPQISSVPNGFLFVNKIKSLFRC